MMQVGNEDKVTSMPYMALMTKMSLTKKSKRKYEAISIASVFKAIELKMNILRLMQLS
jgi:hypothetical protein